MTTNSYFKSNFVQGPDQSLLDSLTVESIQRNGRDVYYLPRHYVAFDRLYGEDKLSAFSNYYTIEMYLESFQNFEGLHEIGSRFGNEFRDQVTLVVSRTRFNDVVTSDYAAAALPPTGSGVVSGIPRPREGDLIFFPYDQSLFEIDFVDNETVFYQLSKYYIYSIHCKRFELGSESFDTGITKIDTDPINYGIAATVILTTGTGSYQPGEVIYQGTSVANATFMAQVVSYDSSASKLVFTKQKGDPSVSVPLVGFTSNASWGITSNSDGDVTQTVSDTGANNQNKVLNDLQSGVVVVNKNPTAYGY